VVLDTAIEKHKRDTARRVRERDADGVVGIVVEYGIGMGLRKARDGAWHDGMSAAEKVRETGKHMYEYDGSVAEKVC
jgi:hypothetical protein